MRSLLAALTLSIIGVAAIAEAQTGDIVFVSTRDGNPEIYSVNADGTNLTRLTNNPANDDAPVWSPDGKRIAFASDRDGSWEIYVMNADGTNVVRRTFSASYSRDPCWSPDGNRIVYSTLSNLALNIWTVNPDSGSPALLLEMRGTMPIRRCRQMAAGSRSPAIGTLTISCMTSSSRMPMAPGGRD